MKLKSKFLVGALFISVVLPSQSLAAQDEPISQEKSALGGWVEGEGYWVDGNNDSFGIQSSPDSHQGWVQLGSGDNYRAAAVTHWSGTYHYSRAQLYTRPVIGSEVVTADSYRVYGTGSTEAYSGWRTVWPRDSA